MKEPYRFSRIASIFILLVALGIFQVLFIAGYGWFSRCPEGGVDTLVVLGNRVYPNGRMSPVLQHRVDVALHAYENGCAAYIITSGATGTEGQPEGTVMGNYLITMGVPEDRVIIDDNGINSHMTAVNTKKIFDERGFDSVAVVTSYYHVYRAKLAMRQEGIEQAYGIGSRYVAFQDLWKVPRDLVGSYVYLFKY